MSKFFAKIFSAQTITIVAIILIVAGYGFVSYRDATSIENPVNRHYLTVAEEENVYARFVMEAYDSISDNYWMKVGSYSKYNSPELPAIFNSALIDAASTAGLTVASSTGNSSSNSMTNQDVNTILNLPANSATTATITDDRSKLAKTFGDFFGMATSSEVKADLARKTVEDVMKRLAPYGRNGLMSEQQRVAMRQEVSNIDTSKDLYKTIGVTKDATPKEIEKAVAVKVAALEKSTSTTAKAEIKETKYIKSVLTDIASKARYDQTGAEPVVFSKIEGQTLYVYLKQVSPTTLQEFVNILNNIADKKYLTGMVIDLRGNIGGDFSSANSFIGIFIGPNQYAFDLFRKESYNHEYTTQSKYSGLERFKDIAILTDNMTQSTAEIISATLKKFKIAKVVGSRTAGWGTVENTYGLKTVIDPSQKYTLYLVNNLTIGDNNQPIQGNGVAADVDAGLQDWNARLGDFFSSKSLTDVIKERIVQKPSEVNLF